MKLIVIILWVSLLVACKTPTTASPPKEARMPASDLVQILKDHLPESEIKRLESASKDKDQFDLDLTAEQFERLRFAFVNNIENFSRATYSYDHFVRRATTFTEGFSSFSVSLGKGKNYHYVITGSFVLVDGRGKAVIWIKPTRG